ncbi:hypothetical protein M0R72_00110 [Candidatus Pacearchaeota archaeon]|jgi:hypothetical protein|nr:hypothetical protein [Candidatus Pacearchaeota archaeon]
MEILIDPETLNSLPGSEKVPLKCRECGSVFHRKAKDVRFDLKTTLKKRNSSGIYCSNKCKTTSLDKRTDEPCGQCGKKFLAKNISKKNSKSEKVFCSRSCAVTYNNTHKTTGIRRSKLEVWLESQIATKFPTLEVLYNNKEAIDSELDIYFPTLKLAFELNGIVHYEPIYGKKKFDSIHNNDNRKFKACHDKQIDLCIIDTSGLKYFKPQSSEKYWDIIQQILNERLASSQSEWEKCKRLIDELNQDSDDEIITIGDDVEAYKQYLNEGIDHFHPRLCPELDVRAVQEVVIGTPTLSQIQNQIKQTKSLYAITYFEQSSAFKKSRTTHNHSQLPPTTKKTHTKKEDLLELPIQVGATTEIEIKGLELCSSPCTPGVLPPPRTLTDSDRDIIIAEANAWNREFAKRVANIEIYR